MFLDHNLLTTFHFLYMLKTNETELIDESADVCLHFSGHVTSHAFGRVLNFVGIRPAHTSFSPFTLAVTTSGIVWQIFLSHMYGLR